MKKLLLLSFYFLLSSFYLQAQAPQAFKYQAVIRDASGQILADQAVGLQINLIEEVDFDTSSVYIETHAATTNAFGLVNLQIGRGTPVSGDFSQVNWENPTYIQIRLDASGGTNYQEMGIAELLSVPYALYAGNAGNNEDADADPTNELQDWTTLPGIPADILDGDQVDDADADPTNELQTITQEGSNVTLSNDGGTISVDDADADPTNEIEMPTDAPVGALTYYDGTNWVVVPPGKPGNKLVLGGDGIPTWQSEFLTVTLSNGTVIEIFPEVNVEKIGWNPDNTNSGIPDIPNLLSHASISALDADLNGPSNTEAIVAFYGDGNYAAKFCQDLTARGFSDWYLPASGELKEINNILGLNGTEEINMGEYYSSSRTTGTVAIWDFSTQSYVFGPDNSPRSCRCVRRP